jgi:predicted AAA+ superfamily ATPase
MLNYIKDYNIIESMKNEKIALIQRDEYIKDIENYIDKPIIKVLIGMRRVGKSAIIKLLIDKLLKKDIPASNIIYINKESLEFDEIKNYKDLYRYVLNYFKGVKNRKYIFIDEIQEIAEWEKTVNSFLADNYGDIIISGSNSKLLSSELATLLSGRYIEMPVYPLTFKEFLRFRLKKTDKETEFKNFLRYGGLPGIHLLPLNDDAVFVYLNSILNTVLYNDVIIRHKIRDAAVFDKIVKYLFDNIGNITTAKKIADYFKSQKVKVSVDTVLNYISYLETSLIIDTVPRYDIKGKKFLEFHDKFFLNDIGLRNGFIGYREKDINGLLENIVYKELQSRGYKVSVGAINQFEIDFIAEKQNDIKYIQVCYLLNDKSIIDREFGNLEKIRDNYEKIVVSMDKFFPEDRNGIIHQNLIDFLMA